MKEGRRLVDQQGTGACVSRTWGRRHLHLSLRFVRCFEILDMFHFGQFFFER